MANKPSRWVGESRMISFKIYKDLQLFTKANAYFWQISDGRPHGDVLTLY